jgi:hypothetical protein
MEKCYMVKTQTEREKIQSEVFYYFKKTVNFFMGLFIAALLIPLVLMLMHPMAFIELFLGILDITNPLFQRVAVGLFFSITPVIYLVCAIGRWTGLFKELNPYSFWSNREYGWTIAELICYIIPKAILFDFPKFLWEKREVIVQKIKQFIERNRITAEKPSGTKTMKTKSFFEQYKQKQYQARIAIGEQATIEQRFRQFFKAGFWLPGTHAHLLDNYFAKSSAVRTSSTDADRYRIGIAEFRDDEFQLLFDSQVFPDTRISEQFADFSYWEKLSPFEKTKNVVSLLLSIPWQVASLILYIATFWLHDKNWRGFKSLPMLPVYIYRNCFDLTGPNPWKQTTVLLLLALFFVMPALYPSIAKALASWAYAFLIPAVGLFLFSVGYKTSDDEVLSKGLMDLAAFFFFIPGVFSFVVTNINVAVGITAITVPTFVVPLLLLGIGISSYNAFYGNTFEDFIRMFTLQSLPFRIFRDPLLKPEKFVEQIDRDTATFQREMLPCGVAGYRCTQGKPGEIVISHRDFYAGSILLDAGRTSVELRTRSYLKPDGTLVLVTADPNGQQAYGLSVDESALIIEHPTERNKNATVWRTIDGHYHVRFSHLYTDQQVTADAMQEYLKENGYTQIQKIETCTKVQKEGSNFVVYKNGDQPKSFLSIAEVKEYLLAQNEDPRRVDLLDPDFYEVTVVRPTKEARNVYQIKRLHNGEDAQFNRQAVFIRYSQKKQKKLDEGFYPYRAAPSIAAEDSPSSAAPVKITTTSLRDYCQPESKEEEAIQTAIALQISLLEANRGVDREQLRKTQTVKSHVKAHGYSVRTVDGDGNCLFAAAAIEINRIFPPILDAKKVTHVTLRAKIARHVEENWQRFQDFVPQDKREGYVSALKQDGIWGDHLSVIALTEIYNVGAVIIGVDPENKPLIVLPDKKNKRGDGKPKHMAYFAYNGVHYDAVAGVPSPKESGSEKHQELQLRIAEKISSQYVPKKSEPLSSSSPSHSPVLGVLGGVGGGHVLGADPHRNFPGVGLFDGAIPPSYKAGYYAWTRQITSEEMYDVDLAQKDIPVLLDYVPTGRSPASPTPSPTPSDVGE